MGRKSKPKTTPQVDLARAARIQSMREKDRALREAVEKTLKATKDLSDRGYYARLSETAGDRTEKLLGRLKDVLERDRIEAHGQCIFANHQISQECDRLQDELDRREGRPTHPDPLTQVEPVLAGLDPKQASAIRFVAMLQASATAPETTDAFEKASAFIDEFETIAADLRREAGLLVELGEEKERRGWADAKDIDRYRTELTGFLAKVDAAVAESRDRLQRDRTEYEALSRRRLALRQALQGQVAR
jgi:hypothetical protein